MLPYPTYASVLTELCLSCSVVLVVTGAETKNLKIVMYKDFIYRKTMGTENFIVKLI